MTEQAQQEAAQKAPEIAQVLRQLWGKKLDENIARGRSAVKAIGLPDDVLTSIGSSIGTRASSSGHSMSAS